MDCLPDKEVLCQLLQDYGQFAIFGLLALGIIALPVPEETLLVFTGILIDHGHLHFLSTLISGYAGSISGITVSYLMGRLAGNYFLEKHGRWIGFSKEKIDKIHDWFEIYGSWTLFFGYFVPGVRHFTGFFAGMSRLEFRKFALSAYLGAIFWVTTFVSLGYFFGSYGLSLLQALEIRVEFIGIALLVSLLLYFTYKFYKKKFSP